MDFSRIKKLIAQGGEKFILIENGEPELVILSFEEYERLLGRLGPTKPLVKKSEENFPWDDEYPYEKPFIDPKSSDLLPMALGDSVGLPVRLEDIRVEDLPI